MNNLTEQEAYVIAEFINEYVFSAIKQDEIDNIERMLSVQCNRNRQYAMLLGKDGR